MGDDDYRLAVIIAEVEEKLMDLVLCLRVEIAGRFIGEEDGRIVDKCPGYGDSLLLSAGEFGWLVVHPFGKPHVRKQPGSSGMRVLVGTARDECGDHHVFEGSELRQKVMELEYETDLAVPEGRKLLTGEFKDRSAVDFQSPGIRSRECTEDLQQGGFPGS